MRKLYKEIPLTAITAIDVPLLVRAGSEYTIAILEKQYIRAAGIALDHPDLNLRDLTPRLDVQHVRDALLLCAVGESVQPAYDALARLDEPE